MLERMPSALDPEQGEYLDATAYRLDFRRQDAEIRHHDSWKLERRQHFEEQNHPSWEALRRGEWEESLRLLGENRANLLAVGREDARRGSVFRRTRVVEEPLTPYMQWQLHSLRQWDDCGVPVRVVNADELGGLEVDRRLPELVVLGGRVLYQVLYSDAGRAEGAVRYTDPGLVRTWEACLQRLHAAGEDIQSYFERRVAHLPAPSPTPV
jgi:hypothetical protein